MVLVVALHDPPKPCSDLTRAVMFPLLKFGLYSLELRNHPFLRRHAPNIKSSATREIRTKVRESQEREGLRFSLASLLSVWVARERPNIIRLRGFQDIVKWLRNDFANEVLERDLPAEILLAPGLTVPIGRRVHSP